LYLKGDFPVSRLTSNDPQQGKEHRQPREKNTFHFEKGLSILYRYPNGNHFMFIVFQAKHPNLKKTTAVLCYK
jgi:hypothetical protein